MPTTLPPPNPTTGNHLRQIVRCTAGAVLLLVAIALLRTGFLRAGRHVGDVGTKIGDK